MILEYLFEERRNHVDELRRCTDPAKRSLKVLYQKQLEQDIDHARHEYGEDELYQDEHALLEDEQFIKAHWSQRTSFVSDARTTTVDIYKMLDAEISLWKEALASDESVRQDFQVAIELENLFCFTRRRREKFYFAGNDYHQPMRRNILNCKDLDEVRELDTQFDRTDEDIELHEYTDKSRRKNFFRTSKSAVCGTCPVPACADYLSIEAGFVGLGPANMQKDDVIVVPLGASRPFILRECTDDPGETFTLVGEAVLPGIMHGPWVATRGHTARFYNLR